MEDRRNSLRPFEAARIASFLDGRVVTAVCRFTGGKSSSTYRIELETGEIAVVRLYGAKGSERERGAMALAAQVVPVPCRLGAGEDEWGSWTIFSCLDGGHLESAPEHSCAAARALARIASIELPEPGWIEAGGSVSPFPFNGLEGFIQEALEQGEVRARLGPERLQSLRLLIRQEASRIAELSAEHRLVHGDFNPTNVLIHRGEVSGVLDWEFSHSGTPFMDVGNLMRHSPPHLHEEIRRGLEEGGLALPEDWRRRAALVDLSSHLEFLTSRRSEAHKASCVERIDGLLRGGGKV